MLVVQEVGKPKAEGFCLARTLCCIMPQKAQEQLGMCRADRIPGAASLYDHPRSR